MFARLIVVGIVGFGVTMGLLGCGSGEKPAPAKSDHAGSVHSHEDWWCNEHGVPEEVCALCSTKLAAEFQKKGDWCKTHDRPESQCFICHPEAEAKFAAQYEAKLGKKPPKPTDNGHDHDKKS